MPRCFWCTDDSLYVHYHDHEWGTPLYAAQPLFELLLLEGFQAGLSWITVLRKRAHYRARLFGFDPAQVAHMSDAYLEACLLDPGLIRNRRKLYGARQNARQWLKISDPSAWLWSFVGGAPRINHYAHPQEVPTLSVESQAMSRALKKAGFTFVGPTICYAFMQATGMVMDHLVDCERYAALAVAPGLQSVKCS